MLRLVVSMVVVCGALALAPGEVGRAPAVPDAAAGLSAADWAGIRAAYQAGRHAAVASPGGYEARNPGQRWLTRFDGRGFSTEPDTASWTWGLQLERYGFPGAERGVVRPARVEADGQRVAYDWDPTLQEWYVNDSRGLEHGYTVRERPACGGGGADPLTFTLGVRGDLRPEVEADGRGVRFVDPAGATVLNYAGLVVSDAEGRALAARFEPSGGGLVLAIDERDARYPLTVDPVAQQAYIKASNVNGADQFGASVSISGNTVVVGAFGEASIATGVDGLQSNNDAPYSGAAYVFVHSGSTWSQQAYLKASNSQAGDLFGAAVAISGDTIVVGAQNESSIATGVDGDQFADVAGAAGSAYVFVRNGTTWSQQAYLKASNTEAIDHFGYTVAIQADTVAVAALSEDGSVPGINGNQFDNGLLNSGAVYVFTRSGTTWAQQAYIKASNPDQADEFGFSLSMSGETLVVTADEEDSDATGLNGDQFDDSTAAAGAAYVFVRNGTQWSQQAYVKASNTEAGDHFGWSASVSGDTLAVGATGEGSKATGINGNQLDNTAGGAGAVYVYVRTGSAWLQQAYIKASNTGAQDTFGFSVAASGNTLVVGATGEDSNATGVGGNQGNNSEASSGAAYLFTRNGPIWAQAAYIKASNTGGADLFGWAIALQGDSLVVSARGEASNSSGINGNQGNNQAPSAGASYAFDLGLDAWGDLGLGLAGSDGVPYFAGAGPFSANSSNQFVLIQANPSSLATLVIGMSEIDAPFKGGTMVPQPYQMVVLTTNAAGNLIFPFTMPAGIPAGVSLYFQFWISDPAAVAGFAASNGLKGVTA
jgi:hypothetical protein